MSSCSFNKRRRTGEEDQTSVDQSIEAALAKIAKAAKLQQLVVDILFHDTYCPLIIRFFDAKWIWEKGRHITKYHHILLTSHALTWRLFFFRRPSWQLNLWRSNGKLC